MNYSLHPLINYPKSFPGKWKNRCPDIYFDHNHKILDACQRLNVPASSSLNVPESPAVCCGRFEVALTEKGLRQSPFDAFLPPQVAAGRKNLFVCGGVIATSLEIKQTATGLRAIGVRVEKEHAIDEVASKTVHLSARREIILSSGAIATPQLLMLSGIGPAEHLKAHGITLVKDLPGVGADLIIRALVFNMQFEDRQDTLHVAEDGNFLLMLKEFVRFLVKGSGLFLSPMPQLSIFALSRLIDEKGNSAPGLVDANDPQNVPDIEIMPSPYDCRDPMYKSILRKNNEGALSFMCVPLRPRSKGTVRLASRDPRARPACDLGTLSDPADLAPLRAAIRLSKAIANKMQSDGYAMRHLHGPPDDASEAELDSFIRSDVTTTFHYSSTCRMAPEAEGGVADDELRVHGVEGLRIADASVFPWIPAAHLQAPVVMVAERCADFILKARSG